MPSANSKDQTDQLEAMRHSAAHVLAAAVQRLWPDAKFGVGPVIEHGFYYDIDTGDNPISEDDFKRIEKEMKKIVSEAQDFVQEDVEISRALQWAEDTNQPYKLELLNDLRREGTTLAKDLDPSMMGVAAASLGAPNVGAQTEVGFYQNGDFRDLCRGPHVANTKDIGAFKLMRIAGAYWRGKEDNPQMQRLYGVAFNTKDELHQHLQNLEEAKKRDHRKIGKEMDLFTFSELVGPGLPLWTPRGTVIRMELDKFIGEMRREYGYDPVEIPHITKKDLYEKSGHWDKFGEELFSMTTREGHQFVMKPMNCPHHTQIYDSRPRSYKDLPIRYSNTTMVYRDEQSGELGGLSRVRAITQDDAHVFCRDEQIKAEALKIWDIVERFYAAFNMEVRPELSFMDPDAKDRYSGKQELWDSAQSTLQEIVEDKLGEKVEVGIGEAAFYGPKIDFQAKDALGRDHQVATIQLDFNQPEGFDLTCINEKGDEERIVMIHAAIAGSFERFLSVLIEHTAGKFPLWLAPEQLRLITVSEDDKMVAKAEELAALARKAGLRVSIDAEAESVGKKIRSSSVDKVPYTIVVGEKEVESSKGTPRIRADLIAEGQDEAEYELTDFIEQLAKAATSRTQLES